MKFYPYMRVDIYESGSYPVVSHIFYGKTLHEARGYFLTHMKTDEFLRDAVRNQEWNGISLQVKMTDHNGVA